ncbi:MAG: alpha/beta fold hydrolase [Pseudomonadota bacterium]
MLDCSEFAVPLPPGARGWDQGYRLKAGDGVGLRAALWNPGGSRGLALYLSGRTEFLEKAAIAVTALVDRDFAVATVDWRGQGLSDRLLADPMKGHVKTFEDFDLDLLALMAVPAIAREGPVRLVLGHSMGGAIALGAAARGVLAPGAMLLSAPMAGINMPPLVDRVSRVIARTMRGIGLGDRWPPKSDAGTAYVLNPFEGNCLTHDTEIYAWQGQALTAEPRLALGLPTFGWMAAAYDATRLIAKLGPLGFPVAVHVGSKEGVVDPEAAKTLAGCIGARFEVIEDARHDLLAEDARRRADFWSAGDRFLAEAGV